MLFTSYKYFVFVVAAFCVYYLVARFSRKTRRIPGVRLQNVALVVLGYGFYAFWDWRWLFLLAGVTATGYGGALLLRRFAAHRRLRFDDFAHDAVDPHAVVLRVIARSAFRPGYRTDDDFLQKQLGGELIFTTPEEIAATLRSAFARA